MRKLKGSIIDHSLRRCDLRGCNHQAFAIVQGKHVCGFHVALLTAARQDIAEQIERREPQGSEDFGLSVEDEHELEKPGDKTS